MNRPMTNRKPNWIKACEDTQKKLEEESEYQLGYRTDWPTWSDGENCSFCRMIGLMKNHKYLRDCPNCLIGSICQQPCSDTEWILPLFCHNSGISHIFALWLWLEDLKGMLGRGEI
jgi:hypothetical protein